MPRYSGQFPVDKSSYDADYIPIDQTPLRDWLPLLNTTIMSIVVGVLLISIATMLTTARQVVTLCSRKGSWRERLSALSSAPASYLFLALTGYLLLLIDDVPTAFYRSFHINFMLVVLTCLASSTLYRKFKSLLLLLGILSVVVSVASAVVAHSEMDAKFVGGWQGGFIKLQTNWTAVRSNVDQISKRCNVAGTEYRHRHRRSHLRRDEAPLASYSHHLSRLRDGSGRSKACCANGLTAATIGDSNHHAMPIAVSLWFEAAT